MPISDQGLQNSRYRLIPRTLVFLTEGDQVLLLKGAPHKRLWANLYNGVGGHIEPGEDVFTAANREFQEETGIHPGRLWLCGVITIDGDLSEHPPVGVVVFVFRGALSAGHPEQPLRPGSEGSLEWVPLDRVYDLGLVEDLPELLPRVLEFEPGRPPFAANYSYAPDGTLKIAWG